MEPAFLPGSRIYLRRLVESDLSAEYLAWMNDASVTQYLRSGRFPTSIADLRAYLARFEPGAPDAVFAIIDLATDTHVGNVALNNVNWVDRNADTGLLIGRREFWGKGYAQEAWSLVIRYAFDRLNLHKLIAGTVAANTASLNALKRLGFREEGLLREEHYVNGMYHDVVRLGLLRGEFRAGPTAVQRTESGAGPCH